jgi:hypothetical protein
MARDRIIYQSESLYTSLINPDGNTAAVVETSDFKEINRVQDMSYNLEVTRTDINEFGQLAALSREVTEPPTVSLDFSYYLTNGIEEKNLGFVTNDAVAMPVTTANPFMKSLLDPDDTNSGFGAAKADELNYYIVTTKEGNDLHGTSTMAHADQGCIAIGNGFITSYGISAAVGELATASVSVEASNIVFKNDISSNMANPAIDVASTTGAKLGTGASVKFTGVTSSTGSSNHQVGGSEVFALRPGDISIDFDATGYFANASNAGGLQVGGAILPGQGTDSSHGSKTAIHVQSVSLDLPVSRTPLTKLGSHFPFARKIDFPVTVTLSVSALMADFDDGSLDTLICNAEEKRDIALVMKDRCGSGEALTWVLRNAILDSESFSASIGDNKSVDLTFSGQIGGANDSDNGVFCFTNMTSAPGAYDPDGTPTVTVTPSVSVTPSVTPSVTLTP